MDNEIWRLEPGWLAAYTEDRDIMRRVKRYKSWPIMAEYYDGKHKKAFALQYRVPITERRQAERLFNV